MGRIKELFTDQGITPADFPLALLYHELISIAFAAAVWGACFHLRPTLTVAGPLGAALPVGARQASSRAFRGALGVAERALAKRAWLKRLPGVGGADQRVLVVSLAESLCVRAALKPVTLVGKVVLSYEALKATKMLVARTRRQAEPVPAK